MAKIGWLAWSTREGEPPEFHKVEPDRWRYKLVTRIVYFEVKDEE